MEKLKTCRFVARLFLHAVLVGASGAILWGLVQTANDAKSCWLGTNCLLFGTVEKNTTACGLTSLHTVRGGNVGACHYSLFFAIAQLLAGLVLFVIAILRWCAGNWERSRCLNVTELAIVVVATLACLVAAIILSAGLGILCRHVTDNFRPEPSLLVSPSPPRWKKPGCSSAYIAQDVKVSFNVTGNGKYSNTFEKLFFYSKLNIAQIGGWVSVTAWLLLTAISGITLKTSNRGDDTHPGRYSRLTNPAEDVTL